MLTQAPPALVGLGGKTRTLPRTQFLALKRNTFHARFQRISAEGRQKRENSCENCHRNQKRDQETGFDDTSDDV